eukprot:1208130-Amphidinium_carterae.3
MLLSRRQWRQWTMQRNWFGEHRQLGYAHQSQCRSLTVLQSAGYVSEGPDSGKSIGCIDNTFQCEENREGQLHPNNGAR